MSYLVLDEGKPVRRSRGFEGKAWYFSGQPTSSLPVALFLSLRIAKRVKLSLRQRYSKQANCFDPALGGDQKRCFDLWAKRAKELRIVSCKTDVVSLEEIDRG